MGALRVPAAPDVRAGRLRTYSHLAGQRRVPSEYEVATSDLLYYVKKGGFEVSVPLDAWYEAHQRRSPLRCSDWERFRDPRETTYTKYTAARRAQEEFLDRLIAAADARGDAPPLDEGWSVLVARLLGPARFAFHGLQMIASYVGHMAPSGRITITLALQAADEMRRVQRVAERLGRLRRDRPDLAAESRALWQEHPAWQPLRRALEGLLVTYDWGEALVALNVCLKPALDALLLGSLAGLARLRGDALLAEVLASLGEDAAWQRDWTLALLEVAIADDPANRSVIAGFVERAAPVTREGVLGLAPLLGKAGPAAAEEALGTARAFSRAVLGGEG